MAGEVSETVEQIGLEVRRMNAQSIVTSQIIADRFGLNMTDLECLDLLSMRQAATPTELAAATGLTTGATTALIDRLERAGYVYRSPDPMDRRKTIVRIRDSATRPIGDTYEAMYRKMVALWAEFSPADQAMILAFLRSTTDLAIECTHDLTAEPNRAIMRDGG